VLVTSASGSSPELVRLLEDAGATVTITSLIRIAPPPDEAALQAAVDRAHEADWLAFTSVAGVEAFAHRRHQPLGDLVRLAAVGSGTQAALQGYLQASAAVVPATFSGSALADALISHARPGARVLFFAAHGASPVLESKLRAAGLSVEKVVAYQTIESPPRDLAQRVKESDAITLASPSAVRALVKGLGADAALLLRGKLLACIGPVTLAEARERGLHVEIVPEASTFAAVVEALSRYYTMNR